MVRVRLFYFLQVGLNSSGISCFRPTPLGHMPVSDNIDMNLCIHFTGRCIASLALPQHRIYKGEVNASKTSTVVRPPQTPLQTSPLQQALLFQQVPKMRLAWGLRERGLLDLRSSLLWLYQSVFRVQGQSIAQDTSLE